MKPIRLNADHILRIALAAGNHSPHYTRILNAHRYANERPQNYDERLKEYFRKF